MSEHIVKATTLGPQGLSAHFQVLLLHCYMHLY